jgi:RimJ/RimL family protein N-acetyltransferase
MINWANRYKVLKNKNFFSKDNFSIVPIRYEDRYQIMRWRNQQLYHLRQNKKLTKKDQDNYFLNVIGKQFDEIKPNQILFSFLEKKVCIGYGGLVHINWIDKNAEISFVMNTILEKDFFAVYWGVFLSLIEKVSFKILHLNKIYIYAFDVRPNLYSVIESSGFGVEAKLKNHVLVDKQFCDVIIHSKFS